MLAELAIEDHDRLPVSAVPRMFAPDEIGWLSNEARILRAFSGHEVWIEDPDLGTGPFRRLAYHPRLTAAVAEIAGVEAAVESTRMLYARRGIVSPSTPYWRTGEPESTGAGPLAIVFLSEAEVGLPVPADGRLHRIDGAPGDVIVLASGNSRLTATTDGHLAPLFLVQFGCKPRLHGDYGIAPPRLADDCLWQPAYWTAG